MNQYEIEIFNIKDDAEMNVIQHALHDAGITDAGDQESGPYLQWGHARSVFVDPSEVQKAVEVLNSLGYETDEDGDAEAADKVTIEITERDGSPDNLKNIRIQVNDWSEEDVSISAYVWGDSEEDTIYMEDVEMLDGFKLLNEDEILEAVKADEIEKAIFKIEVDMTAMRKYQEMWYDILNHDPDDWNS